jgi:hypothetical protein
MPVENTTERVPEVEAAVFIPYYYRAVIPDAT